jgi:hypothetical protein
MSLGALILDRAIVEVILLAAILSMAALGCSSFAAQFGVMSSWSMALGLNNIALGASSTLAEAASEANLCGGSAHLLLVLPYAATLNASGSTLTAASQGSSVEISLPVHAWGGGTGRIFDITAYANGTLFIDAEANGS